MKKIIIISLTLWLGNNYNAQTKWIAHKSHSGKMNTFSLKHIDNLGCKQGDFLELSASNYDLLGNECLRPIILKNGMIIKDPKLDSIGFINSHKEINRLARLDSTNYYRYKIVYDSIMDINYPIITTVKKVEPNIDKETKKLDVIVAPKEIQKKQRSKKKKNKSKPKSEPQSKTNITTTPAKVNIKVTPTSNNDSSEVKKSGIPILPIVFLILGVILLTVKKKIIHKQS